MAGDSLSEQEIQFRKRARRRLIGAIALVLLMVTLLPMVLDDQAPEGPEQEIAISIPSQDGADFSSKVTPAPAIPATGPAPAPVEMPPPVVAVPPAPAPSAAVDPAAQARPGKPPASKAPARPLPASDDPVKPPLPAPKSTPDAATTADTELPKAEAKDTTTSAKSGFSVQIGVFSDAAKVKRLQSTLKGQGIATYTEKLGNKIRMRSGPYPTRVAAEEVQARLKQMKMASMVVTNK
ncbi:MAG: sporulation protein [Methylobacterium sp.]|nr:sporulation protein [Methylobacterium sp.]